jgi:hypothetical protein
MARSILAVIGALLAIVAVAGASNFLPSIHNTFPPVNSTILYDISSSNLSPGEMRTHAQALAISPTLNLARPHFLRLLRVFHIKRKFAFSFLFYLDSCRVVFLGATLYGWGSRERLAQSSRTYALDKLILRLMDGNSGGIDSPKTFVGTPVKTLWCGNEFYVVTCTHQFTQRLLSHSFEIVP